MTATLKWLPLVLVLTLLSRPSLASHSIEPPYAGMPSYRKQSTFFSLLAPGREIEDFDDASIVSISGAYSTWVDVETGEYFLYVTPLVRTTDLPDRLTIFAQFSTKDDLYHQSVICDMYTSIDSSENPY